MRSRSRAGHHAAADWERLELSHLLIHHRTEGLRNTSNGREAVGVLMLQHEHECIDGDCQQVRLP